MRPLACPASALQVVSLAGVLPDSRFVAPPKEITEALYTPNATALSRAELFFPLKTSEGRPASYTRPPGTAIATAERMVALPAVWSHRLLLLTE